MELQVLIAVFIGIGILLFLILKLKIQAFLALLVVCILVGIMAGMPAGEIVETMKEGMGNTLGFVATVVGLGALFGGILEQSGGAKGLAKFMLKKTGEKNAPWAMMFTGFLIAIPVFFDVAFIILVPVAYALSRSTGKSLLLYALPLLAGLAITHAFIPPTPGPIAVSEILGADLGWVILFGLLTGLPTAVISGPLFARYISKKIYIEPQEYTEAEEIKVSSPPSPQLILLIIFVPIILIVLNTVINSPFMAESAVSENFGEAIALIGHPFTALIIANLLAWYFIGIRRGMGRDFLLKISTKSFQSAGIILLLTGAGGAFKQILIATGAGDMIASTMNSEFFSPLIFGFIIAALVRVLQGSSTVAMITAAGITAPVIGAGSYSIPEISIIVIAIAAGASTFSHVNDSGFWLVGQYLGLTEKQTFKTWTLMTGIISFSGLIMSLIIWYIL
ncbi:gluconate transporter [Christiangramia fulva]|uniref:Gluconate transporter n=1 Tax=Christiangramia fulva TaxID=2126553 RepID=A0A2R3Z7R3_9FLAO|nr:gluconate:H+ symporter [Christiangramia fulva]AVR46333.1 gluconate transporter [Christiangramia fulva]